MRRSPERPRSAVVWSVNGVAHGNATTGAISSSGLYTPATTIWAGHSVNVSAASTVTPALSASINVKMVNPLPVFTSATLLFTAPGSYLLDVKGAAFFPASQLVVAGVNVATTYVSSTELQSNITLPAGTITVKAGVLNPNAGQSAPVSQTLSVPAGPRASIAQATRLLDQATFGPTLSATQHVQLVGMPAYLTEQFSTPATLMPPIPNPTGRAVSRCYVPLCPALLLEKCAHRKRSASPARSLRPQRNVRGLDQRGERAFHPCISERAGQRCLHQLPADHGRRYAFPCDGCLSEYAQQWRGARRTNRQ